MSARAKFPLMAKMLIWLMVHFGVLAASFLIFVNWQLEKGLDSLLSGASAERLNTLGDAVASELRASERADWPDIVVQQLKPYGVRAILRMDDGEVVVGKALQVPEEIDEQLREYGRPPGRRGPGQGPPPWEKSDGGEPPGPGEDEGPGWGGGPPGPPQEDGRPDDKRRGPGARKDR